MKNLRWEKGLKKHISTDPTCVEKKWGTERIIHNGEYCEKIMTIQPGYQVSKHAHRVKRETFTVVLGSLVVEVSDPKTSKTETFKLHAYDSITIEPMFFHTFYCPDDQNHETTFIECSMPDSPEDNIRVSRSGLRQL